MKHHFRLRNLRFAAKLVFAAWLFVAATTTDAQQSGVWTAPVVLSGDREAYFPAIAADESGQVHALWIERFDKQFPGWGDGLTYARLSDGVWSKPVDVLRNPWGVDTAVSPPAIASAGGRVHAVWSGTSGLYYSSTAIGAPISTKSWDPAIRLTEGGGAPFIVADSKGTLHVTTLDSVSANPGIDYVRSTDNGHTWTSPARLSPAIRNPEQVGALAYSTYMLVDHDDGLHVAWTNPFDGGTYYVRSTDGGDTWSEPFPIDPVGANEVDTSTSPSIGQDNDGNLHLIWQAKHGVGESCTRYHRLSTDRGATWSPRERIFFSQFQGCLGWNMMRQDSAGTLHLLTIGRLGDGEHRLFHSAWRDGQWAPAVWVAGVGTPTTVDWDLVGIDQSQLAITEGNQLHAVWVTRDRRVWYTSMTTAASYVQPQPIPTEAPVVLVATTAPAVAVDTGTSFETDREDSAAPPGTPMTSKAAPGPSPSGAPWVALAIGVLPSSILIIGIVAIVSRRRTRHS